eukprot:TRINITY_DN7683_c0_g1_i1.p1 TRINITY_DN7683_c0_g1~~TRINITY_DN7683_c0_g1_i1.p1  ORF type:complete len:536 (-),score=55.00 TRINITY_DN7683_c0_g1_i1:5-1612(-)
MEDLAKTFPITKENLPMVVEFPIWHADEFLSDDAIRSGIEKIKSQYSKLGDKRFILKILGKLAVDIPQLNTKSLLCASLLSGTPILMEVSYERLILLSELEDSIFKNPWVYPSLRYFLRQGDEELFLTEMATLFQSISLFKGIQIVLTISISRPFPRLHDFLTLARSHIGFIRIIIFSLERPPMDILSSLRKKHAQTKKKSTAEKKKTKESSTAPVFRERDRTVQVHYEKTQILAGKSFEVIRSVTNAGDKLTWSFRVENKYDIQFGVYFEELSSFSLEAIRAPTKLLEGEGSLIAEKAGIYKLRWDNRHSRFRKKVLSYKASIVASEDHQNHESESSGVPIIDNIDPSAFLDLIGAQTNGEISREDFFPVTAGRVLEPLLSSLQYGNYTIRPNPFCAFMTCLINTETLKSVPISRFVDIDKFFFNMLEFMPKLETATKNTNVVRGFFNAKRIAKIVKKCATENPPQKMPDLAKYVLDPTKADAVRDFFDNLQFVLVHNKMDIAALDIKRRCQCSNATSYPGAPSGFAASCTGCV